MQIQGGNNNQPMGVSSLNRAFTSSETFDPDEVGALNLTPATFSWATASVTLTSATISAILAVQNTSATPLLIRYINIGLGQSTAGTTSNAILSTIINGAALTGTIISAPSGVSNGVCRNAGVSSFATASGVFGTEGKTITNGTTIGTDLLRVQTWTTLPGSGLVLPQNAAIGLSITPPAANTSIIVTAVIVGTYVAQAEVVA